ncbi:hypothetical protein [Streptomyces sp. C10-9-1]|uniref:hypothetical protein n=1 Tax=Streptomyces sp. C10-9-1 TaxID=1859285 RepID=UPI003D74FAEB
MHDPHTHDPRDHGGADPDACAAALRAALAAHGITLPSLGVDLPGYAGRHPVRPLIALGNCNLAAARELTAVLLKGAV